MNDVDIIEVPEPSLERLLLPLFSYARVMLTRLWEPGTVYHKTSVVLDGLEPPGTGQQLDLFGSPAPAPNQNQREEKVVTDEQPALMAILDALNQRFGRGTVRLASVVLPPAAGGKSARAPWEGKARWCSPAFTTRLEDLLLVN